MNKDVIRQKFYKFLNKYLGKCCQNCGIKKFHVRRYDGVCSKCFNKHKIREDNRIYRKERKSELRRYGHRLIDKIITKMPVNKDGYNSKKERKRRLYWWLEKNLTNGHFKDMRDGAEMKYAIKRLKEIEKSKKLIKRI